MENSLSYSNETMGDNYDEDCRIIEDGIALPGAGIAHGQPTSEPHRYVPNASYARPSSYYRTLRKRKARLLTQQQSAPPIGDDPLLAPNVHDRQDHSVDQLSAPAHARSRPLRSSSHTEAPLTSEFIHDDQDLADPQLALDRQVNANSSDQADDALSQQLRDISSQLSNALQSSFADSAAETRTVALRARLLCKQLCAIWKGVQQQHAALLDEKKSINALRANQATADTDTLKSIDSRIATNTGQVGKLTAVLRQRGEDESQTHALQAGRVEQLGELIKQLQTVHSDEQRAQAIQAGKVKELQGALDRMTLSNKTELDRMSAQAALSAERLVQMERQHQSELQDQRHGAKLAMATDIQKKVLQLSQEHKRDLASAEVAFDANVQKQSSTFKQTVLELTEKHKQDIRSAKTEFEAENQELQQQQALALKDATAAFDKAAQDLREGYQQDLAAARAACDREVQELRKTQQKDILATESAFDKEVRELRAHYQQHFDVEMQEIREEYRRRHEDAETAYEQRLSQVRKAASQREEAEESSRTAEVTEYKATIAEKSRLIGKLKARLDEQDGAHTHTYTQSPQMSGRRDRAPTPKRPRIEKHATELGHSANDAVASEKRKRETSSPIQISSRTSSPAARAASPPVPTIERPATPGKKGQPSKQMPPPRRRSSGTSAIGEVGDDELPERPVFGQRDTASATPSEPDRNSRPQRSASRTLPKTESPAKTMSDIWAVLCFLDPVNGTRKPASKLNKTVQKAIEPSLHKFQSASAFKRLCQGVATHHRVCAHTRSAKGHREPMPDQRPCENCRYKRQACIMMEPDFSPTIVPLPASERKGLRPGDVGYWISQDED